MTRISVSMMMAGALALAALMPATGTAGDVDPSESRLIAAGQAALEQGRTDLAIDLLREGIRQTMAPDLRAAGHASLCEAYNTAERPKKALRYCDKALRADADNWQALNDRGKARLALGQPQAAAEDFNRALALRPDNEDVAQNLRSARAALSRPGSGGETD